MIAQRYANTEIDPFDGLGDFEIAEFAILRYRVRELGWVMMTIAPFSYVFRFVFRLAMTLARWLEAHGWS